MRIVNLGAGLFPPGRVVETPGARSAVSDVEFFDFTGKHFSGDWGDVCAEDKRANDRALKDGDRLLSSYKTKKGVKVWIITEWDRSVTTLLLPEEY